MTDCIVVGGGLIGMLTARELALAGKSVVILERGRPGKESSWAGGGILSPLYPWRYGDAVTALASWGQHFYPDLAADRHRCSGVDPEYTRSGLLITDIDELEQATDWAWNSGNDIEVLKGDAINECEPALGTRPEQAIWMPSVAQIRNPCLLRAVYDDLLIKGVPVVHDAEVTELDIQHETIQGVVCEKGKYQAKQVIISGGAWSARLLQLAGVKLAVKPVRGQMIMYKASPLLLQRIVLSEGRYVIPRRDGRILVGSTLEDVGYDKSTTAEARESLQHAAVRLVPGLAEFPVERHWSGLRPGTSGGVPYIGKVSNIKGLYVNAGHYRNGVVLAPASCRLAADIMLGREPIVDPAPYSPGRSDAGTAGMADTDDSGHRIDFV